MLCTGIFIFLGLVSVSISIAMILEARKIIKETLPDWLYQAPLSGYKMDLIEEHDFPLVGCLGWLCLIFGLSMSAIAILRVLTFGLG